jgi:hypothetical protein
LLHAVHEPAQASRHELFQTLSGFLVASPAGFVYTVADNVEDLMKGLGVEKYVTKTRGTREQPAARIAGEGVHAMTAVKPLTQLCNRHVIPQAAWRLRAAIRARC